MFGHFDKNTFISFFDNAYLSHLFFPLNELTKSFFSHEALKFAIDAKISQINEKGEKIPNAFIDQFFVILCKSNLILDDDLSKRVVCSPISPDENMSLQEKLINFYKGQFNDPNNEEPDIRKSVNNPDNTHIIIFGKTIRKDRGRSSPFYYDDLIVAAVTFRIVEEVSIISWIAV